MMKNKKRTNNRSHAGTTIRAFLGRMVCLLPMVALVGCASSYDCYTCGRVNCNYCPPKPLPYSTYESRNCDGSIGQAYLAKLSTRTNVGNSSENGGNFDYYAPVLVPENNADGEKAN
jgi:hypothetical protein